MIGQDTLDRIRRETDLVALISESLKLLRRGRSFVGLCPFHKEKSPSFHVNPERGFYHCFGCHASGDAIKFLQENEGLDFMEAVRRLAERAGIDVEWNVSDVDRRQQLEARRKSDELYEVTSAAAAYFERMRREHPLKAFAEQELERRSLIPASPTDPIADALQAFRIGYAPYGWDGLVAHLREHGMSLPAAERVGLVGARKAGSGYYDRFRHRLMFAVMDPQGRTIAFSGRALDEPPREELSRLGLASAVDASDKPAKYYNSPESPIYRKREALFGIYQARQAIRSSEVCVLVEGNFDVVGLHARGIKNVVAPLGTSFTLEQGQQIRRFCSDIILLFDGDDAGRRAVQASREVCQKMELSARVARLPEGIDPDELARREGRTGVERVLSAARGLLEHLIRDISERPYMKDDAQARVTRLKEAFAVLASEKNPTVRLELKRHVDLLAQNLGFAAETRTIRSLEVEAERAFTVSGPQEQAVAAPRRARSPDRRDDISLAILGALFDFPELVESPEAALAAEVLEGDEALAIGALRHVSGLGQATNSELVLAKLPTSIHPFARARLAAPRHSRVEDAQAELSGNVRQLKALVLSREKKSVVEELERAQRSGDREQEDMLLAEYFRKVREHKVVAPE